MKIKLLALFAIAMSAICPAQITINQSDFVTVGKTFTLGSNNTIFDLLPGGSGQQTWNFSSLVSSADEVYQSQLPQWTPYANAYASSANVALLHSGEYQFLKIDNNAATAVGQTTMGINLVLNPTEKILSFPTSIGSNFTSLSRFKAQIDTNISQTLGTIDSLRIVGRRDRKVSCDAYGTLTTPLGTYESVRVRETVIETDSIYAKFVTFLGAAWISVPAGLGIPNPIIDTSTTYTWYANNLGFKLLSFNYDSINNFSSNTEWLKVAPVVNNISEINNSGLTIYPNPNNGKVSIANMDDAIKTMRIYACDGKHIKDVSVVSGTTNYDLDIVQSGLYYVDLINNKNESIKKEKLIIISNK